MPNKVWKTMNDLEMTTSKICSAREIIDAAIDRIQEHQYDKAETMMSAAYEFLEYYLQEFDERFKLAWKETVVKQNIDSNECDTSGWCEQQGGSGTLDFTSFKQNFNDYFDSQQGNQYTDEELNAMCDKAESDEKKENLNYQDAINSGWSITGDGFWTPPEKESETFQLHIDPAGNEVTPKKWKIPVEVDGPSGEYYITFPDELTENLGWEENDTLEWFDNGDGSWTLKKVKE